MPAVTRIGDADVPHCSGMTRAVGSGDVFCNTIGISRQGDVNTSHLLPGAPCPSHAAPIAVGSPTVFVNTKGCGRIGDAISGCTSVAEGSPNVFCGDAPSLNLDEGDTVDPDPVTTVQQILGFPSLNISPERAQEIVRGRATESFNGIDPDLNESVEYGDGGSGGTSPVTSEVGAVPTPEPTVDDGNTFEDASDEEVREEPPADFDGELLNFLPHTDPRISPDLRRILEEVAREWGQTLTITSAYRSPEYNQRVGGAKRSMHQQGLACDVRLRNTSIPDRQRFIRIAVSKGIQGLGCYFPASGGGQFIHCDIGGKRQWGPSGSRRTQYGWAKSVFREFGYAL